MNALQKLLDAEQYQQFVSKDTILQTVVGPSNAITELDAHIGTMNYEFCATLTELTGKLTARKDARPVFAYTQPQNIHVSVIDHEGRSVPSTENVPVGFDRAYASRVRRIDGCFGNFVRYLKQSGMYDNSIVVLTSDHGDFLGERGQWGHAYSLAPEVTRVPLIVHLPEWIHNQVVADTNAVAFTTDVTPSLYYLLGQKPVVRNGIYGRPLFTSGRDRAGAVHDSYLLASSYAPVYGLLMSNGHLLYVADGVNYTDAAYEIGSDGSNAQIAVTSELRKRGQQGISDQVNEVAHFYRLR
jgi:membrane-anchored protein YejM (alkaline phosphatase superfamily)